MIYLMMHSKIGGLGNRNIYCIKKEWNFKFNSILTLHKFFIIFQPCYKNQIRWNGCAVMLRSEATHDIICIFYMLSIALQRYA